MQIVEIEKKIFNMVIRMTAVKIKTENKVYIYNVNNLLQFRS